MTAPTLRVSLKPSGISTNRTNHDKSANIRYIPPRRALFGACWSSGGAARKGRMMSVCGVPGSLLISAVGTRWASVTAWSVSVRRALGSSRHRLLHRGVSSPPLVFLTLIGLVASIGFSATVVPLAAPASAAPALTATTASVTAAATSAPGTGTVAAWGWNRDGELGNGSTTDSHVPVHVSGLTGVTAIAGGDEAGYALRSDGTVWAWGWNYSGQLGNGTTTDSHVPVQVSGLTGVTAIASGDSAGYALRSDGTVWAWGDNYFGGLGNGTLTSSSVPVQVSGLTGVMAIAGGAGSGYAVRLDGTVWAWGDNGSGEPGNGWNTPNSSVPVQVSGLTGVTAIAAGENETAYAVRSDGTAWAWGRNVDGELGDGTTSTESDVPVQVSGLSGVTAITGGNFSGYALRSDGT